MAPPPSSSSSFSGASLSVSVSLSPFLSLSVKGPLFGFFPDERKLAYLATNKPHGLFDKVFPSGLLFWNKKQLPQLFGQ